LKPELGGAILDSRTEPASESLPSRFRHDGKRAEQAAGAVKLEARHAEQSTLGRGDEDDLDILRGSAERQPTRLE